MTDEKTETEIWVYAGQRQTNRDTLAYAWKDNSDGGLLLFKKIKGSSPGARYEVDVIRSDDGVISIKGEPRYINRETDPELVAEWSAHDRADRAAVDMIRRQKREAQNDPFLDLCVPLRELMRKQVGSTRRAGLLAAIIAEITR